MKRLPIQLLLSVLLIGGATISASGQSPRKVTVRSTPVRDNLYMLSAAGGNICVSVGKDGVLLVDSEYESLVDQVITAVKSITDQPIRLVINTHYHFDHVGGNLKLAQSGALLVAHQQVRARMSSEQHLRGIDRTIPPWPEAALPDITYTSQMSFFWNKDEVTVLQAPAGHTDGDSIIHFRNSNVIHMGDVYFAGTFPFIDVNAGGSIDGMIKAVDLALELSNEQTCIIPGHGPLSKPPDLRKYRKMLVTVRDRVRALIDQGRTRDQVIAGKPTKDLDAQWGKVFKPDMWVGLVYDGMTRQKNDSPPNRE